MGLSVPPQSLVDVSDMLFVTLMMLVLPLDVDYLSVSGLRIEARQKLNAVHPRTIGQASRIPGVNPADISILLLTLRRDGKL